MTTQLIDDQDHSHVTYLGNWIRGGSPGEYGKTVASSTRVNDSFTVAFKGTSISVYGTLDATSGGVVTSYTLDGASAALATSTSVPRDISNQLFWASPALVSAGDHQLVVQMVQVNPNNQTGEGTIWFDYFSVTGAPPPPKKINIRAIVGGVVGGISILILLVLLLLFYRRRRLLKDTPVEPFPAHSGHVPRDTKHHAMASTDQSLTTAPPMQEAAESSSSSYGTPSPPAEPLQHRDSGMRHVDPISALPNQQVELPPIYSPV